MSAPAGTAAALTEQVRALFLPTADGEARSGPGMVGVEVELLPVHLANRPPRPAPPPAVRKALEADPALARDGRLTFEPGGQVELSPPPAPSPAVCLHRLDGLLERLDRCGREAGIGFIPAALSPWSDTLEVGLQNSLPRYLSMQSHFDRRGRAGRRMMRLSAALQVCLDLGGPTRWPLLNRIGPAVAAAFAASPVLAGTVTGEKSTRTALWLQLDPTRTGFDGTQLCGEPLEAYEAFAMEAEAIPLTRDGGTGRNGAVPLPAGGLRMRDWLRAGGQRPDDDDVRHHLSTLFPPVRPRGYHEVRYIDALPLPWARAAICLVAALTATADIERSGLAAVDRSAWPNRASWRRAARLGMEDPSLRQTALSLFEIALDAVPRLPPGYLPINAAQLLAEYRDRFPARGRCPSDELLERHLRDPSGASSWT